MKRVMQAIVLSGLMIVGSAWAQTYQGAGVVKKVDPAKGSVTLKHEAIADLNWPAMTMDFPVRDKAMLGTLKTEQAVKFELRQEKGHYVITTIK